MKILILVSCVLAAASSAYLGPQHIPVIGPNGVPVEPLEVQAARANHLTALASAHSHLPLIAPAHIGYSGVPALSHNALPLDTPEVASAKLQHYRDFAVAAQRNGVHVPYASPLVSAYPVDTPEVQLAKAAHFQAHAEAASRNLPGIHYRKRRDVYGGYHIPVIGPGGVPVEPVEVQAARANHLAALQQAASHSGPAHYAYAAAPTQYAAPAHYAAPVYNTYHGPYAQIGSDGQPVETPEVQAAKAYHFSAYNAALSGRHGHY